eukprot:TRINITY_DN1741_c0_g1_i2.p1 TRINITY_DN1741_c0_g1~~TRINITY_DN1741_c0_g1_i2.p1  ORF type:complete len:315 (+),score=101.19 TRINITY_DN1741_c0_g1_i2:154-1098(+)
MAFVSVAVPRTGAAPNVRAAGLRTCGLTPPRDAWPAPAAASPCLFSSQPPARWPFLAALRYVCSAGFRCPLPFFKNKEDPNRVPLSLECGYVFLAHPEKQTGEDAFFIEGNALGVFDGVGGSANRGVDPRLFSQSLAALTAEGVAERGADKVVACLISAVEANTMAGASTAVVVGLDNVGRVFGVSLGDSGARIIRNGKFICRSKDQAHAFNAPYQLSDLDVSDTVAMGSNISSRVKEGDVLVLASDGLFDNIEEPQLLAIIADADGDMAVASETLGSTAIDLSQRKDIDSPFAKAARKAGVRWRGGEWTTLPY